MDEVRWGILGWGTNKVSVGGSVGGGRVILLILHSDSTIRDHLILPLMKIQLVGHECFRFELCLGHW